MAATPPTEAGAAGRQPAAHGFQDMTLRTVQRLCREQGLPWLAPEACTVLYLHGQRFRKIQGLEGFRHVRVLHLENNCLSSCAGLAHMTELRALYLQDNDLRQVEGLTVCTALVTLNVSHNPLTGWDTGTLPASLLTLHAAAAGLNTAEDVAAIASDCPQLQVLDVQHNTGLAPCERVLPALCTMHDLRVLYTQGTPLSSAANFRRVLISSLRSLHYLDTGPVDAVDRAGADAWARGGRAAEQAARLEWRAEHRRAQRRMTVAFAVERAKRRVANALGPATPAPLLDEDSYNLVTQVVQDLEGGGAAAFPVPTAPPGQSGTPHTAPAGPCMPSGAGGSSAAAPAAADPLVTALPDEAWWAAMLALLPSQQLEQLAGRHVSAPQLALPSGAQGASTQQHHGPASDTAQPGTGPAVVAAAAAAVSGMSLRSGWSSSGGTRQQGSSTDTSAVAVAGLGSPPAPPPRGSWSGAAVDAASPQTGSSGATRSPFSPRTASRAMAAGWRWVSSLRASLAEAPYSPRPTPQHRSPAPGLTRIASRPLFDDASTGNPMTAGSPSPNDVVQQQTSSIECSVCAEDVQRGQLSVTLPCSHVFHAPCIKKWVLVALSTGATGRDDTSSSGGGSTTSPRTRHVTCPLCRAALPIPPWPPAAPSASPVMSPRTSAPPAMHGAALDRSFVLSLPPGVRRFSEADSGTPGAATADAGRAPAADAQPAVGTAAAIPHALTALPARGTTAGIIHHLLGLHEQALGPTLVALAAGAMPGAGSAPRSLGAAHQGAAPLDA